METNNQTTPEPKRNDEVLPLDFNRQTSQSKFPGGPVPDSAEVARMIKERAAAPIEPPPAERAEASAAAISEEIPPAEADVAIPAEPEPFSVSHKTAAPETPLLEKASYHAEAIQVHGKLPGELHGAEIEIPESETATSWLIRRKKKSTPLRFAESASIGKILRDARESSGMTIKDVEGETRIRSTYLEALEQDRFSELPPPVYIRAYLRNLGNLYNLDKKMLEEIMQLHYGEKPGTAISEEIYHQLEKDRQTNVEDEARIKRMILLVASGCTALLILIIGSIFFMVSSSRATREKAPVAATGTATENGVAVTDAKVFSSEKIEQLTVNQELDMGQLPVREEIPRSTRGRTTTSRTRR